MIPSDTGANTEGVLSVWAGTVWAGTMKLAVQPLAHLGMVMVIDCAGISLGGMGTGMAGTLAVWAKAAEERSKGRKIFMVGTRNRH